MSKRVGEGTSAVIKTLTVQGSRQRVQGKRVKGKRFKVKVQGKRFKVVCHWLKNQRSTRSTFSLGCISTSMSRQSLVEYSYTAHYRK